MKISKIIGLTILACMLCQLLPAQAGKEQLVVPLSEPGKAFKLFVGLTTGTIKVTGYEGKDMLIDAQTEPAEEDNDNENTNNAKTGMRRITAHGLDITAEEKNNRVTVHSENPNRNIHLVIKIPLGGGSIQLSSVNSADIEVSNVSAEMEISSVNGGIKLSNVSGSVVANTVNGDVTATFKTIDPNAPMAFSTLNGNVDISFPAALKANVKLKSDQGEIYTDFDVVIDKTQAKVNHTAEGKLYKISVEDWVYGKVNGGGPEMLLKNMNGNIYLRKAK